MPYPQEHSLRILSTSTAHIRVRRTKGSGDATVQGVKIPATISVIWFIVKSNGKEVPRAQALRFPIKTWTETEARNYIKTNKLKGTFEPAAKDTDLFNTYINETKKTLDITLRGVIGSEQSEEIEDLLKKNYKEINLTINSRGGSVFEGLAIYNMLKDYPGAVKAKVTGLAASMASVIAMAADEITIPKTAAIMIHKPMLSLLYGPNADELRHNADILDKLEDMLISTYKPRMKLSNNEIAELLRAETWYNGNEAFEAGLADITTEEETEELDYHDLSKFNNVPQDVFNAYALQADNQIKGVEMDTQEIQNEDISFIQKLKKFFNNIPDTEEEDDMASSEELIKITAELTEIKAELKAKDEKIASLEAELKEYKDNADKANQEKRTSEINTFLDKLIEDGIIRPVDKDFHKSEMSVKDEDGLKVYMDHLKSLPKVVDTTGKHIATGETATTEKKEDTLDKRAKEIMKEKGCLYSVALREAYKENPEAYKPED